MEKMKELGWYLSEQGFNLVSDFEAVNDLTKLEKRAIDLDLKEIGSGEGSITQGNIILQIQKIRNVAAPKNNEESRAVPRMLKLYLTDGKNNYQAVEIEHISSINLNTPPGTKLLIKGETIVITHGIILLKPENIVRVFGGKVLVLIEKWELNKKLASHTRVRSSDEGGPPPWIPFGKKIITRTTEKDVHFKALVEKETHKDNSDFEAQRQDAIAEAARQGNKKVFGGGTKQLLDYSVQKIVDQGFSIEQAEYALKVNRNNVDRALKSLQKNDNKHNREPRSGGGESRENRGKRSDKKSEETKPSSGKLSLFDFLEDKLPNSHLPESTETHTPQYSINDTIINNSSRNYRSSDNGHSSKGNSGMGRGGKPSKIGRAGHHQAPRWHLDNTKSISKQINNENQNIYSQNTTTTHNISMSGGGGGGGNFRQTKPPRFLKHQDFYHHHQGDNNPKKFVDRKNTFTQSRSDYNTSINTIPTTAISTTTIITTATATTSTITATTATTVNFNEFPAASSSKNQKLVVNNNRYCGQFDVDPSYSKHNKLCQDVNQKLFIADNEYKNQFIGNHQINDASSNHQMFYSNKNNPRNDNNYHNNISSNAAANGDNRWTWKRGDQCMAKYWEDNKYYNAEVTGVSDRTCVVQFKDFNNYEEVFQNDCIPITEDDSQTLEHYQRRRQGNNRNRAPRHDQSKNLPAGMVEYRRGGDNNSGPKGHNKKRIQQRTAQAIYQPPAQRR